MKKITLALTILVSVFFIGVGSTQAAVPKVTNLHVVARHVYQIDLAWKKVKDADSYQVKVLRKTDNRYTTVKKVRSLSRTKIVKALDAGTTYYFKVRAKKGGNYGKYSDRIKTSTKASASQSYTFTYTAGTNGSIVGSATQTVNQGEDGTEVVATPDAHYHFVSWSDGVTTAARTDANASSDITVSASFAIDTYTVTFNSNGGSEVSPITGVPYNTTITLPTDPTKTGYALNGWFSDNETFLIPFTASTAVTADITVYAKWNAPLITPTFSPNSGEIVLGVTPITLSSDTGSTIYYTTDGSTPTTGSSSTATGEAITILSVANPIQAIAVKAGYPDSAMGTSGTYTQSVQATPTFDHAAGAIAHGTTVTITSAGADAIYYTTNGDTPTTSSTNQAITPLVINAEETVKALAVKAGYENSAIGTVAYTALAIGSSYQGGKVAYLLEAGDPGYDASLQHGLIATSADKSTGIIWAVPAYQGTAVTGADATALGTGNQNTIDIVAQNGAGSNFAAGLCSNLSEGGYDDWYLPSKDELNKLYLNKAAIGGFTANYYWSSSESAASTAWGQNFDEGTQFNDGKVNTDYVRAIRSF
ncbi:MAG: chitobiase/beta-hexosaminidase C-terminal domain-containing protein [Patescibacteria group bacterium]|jgi:uncharacterized repeat protein (TIGR02543 family)